jgi:hypothetical protein
MIVGRSFVWAHLGKAGGEMTHALFNVFPEVVESDDESHVSRKHAAFCDHPDEVAGRQRVLNIRRLPTWMLSHHVWRSAKGLAPTFRRVPMMSPYEIAESNVADRFLAKYRPPGEPEIDVWFRTEHLIDDFLAFIARHTEVTDDHREAIRQLPRVNELAYDKALDHWFTPAHIRLMYLRNPQWAAVEAAVYGDIG